MKNLFIINEDERKRILGLHENATKRQYLNEEYYQKKIDFWNNLSQTAKDIIKSICDVRIIQGQDYFVIGERLNANEDNFVRYLTSVENYNDFFKLNTEITNFFNNINITGLKKYAGIDKIIADIIDETGFWRGGFLSADDENIGKLKVFLEKIGISTQDLGSDSYSFANSPNTGNAVADEDKKSGWEKYPCVTQIGKPEKMKDGSTRYVIGGVYYYSNGVKKLSNGEFDKYNCNSPEFVTKKPRVVPTTEDQLLKGQGYLKLDDKNGLVSKIQTMLKTDGQSVQETGVYDKQTYDAVKNFQTQDKTLKVDGILGKNTFSKLKNRINLLSKVEFKAPNISDVNPEDDVVVPT
jgi:hypothetical protein